MPDEVTEWIAATKPRVIIDGTFGGGGHSRQLLQTLDPDRQTPFRLLGLIEIPQLALVRNDWALMDAFSFF